MPEKAVVSQSTTAQFIASSAGSFENEAISAALQEVASLVAEAGTPREKFELLQLNVGSLLTTYRAMLSSMARTAAFLCLAHLVEGLWKHDEDYRPLLLEGRQKGRSDQEAYLDWLGFYLRRLDVDEATISKLKWYCSENYDLAAIDRYSFERAVVVARYSRRFRQQLTAELPEDLKLLAEDTSTRASDLASVMEQRLRIESKVQAHGGTPSPELMDQFEREARSEKVPAIGRPKKAPTSQVHVVVDAEALRSSLAGFTRGSARETLTLLRSLQGLLPKEIDLDKKLFMEFVHTYNVCQLSGIRATAIDPIEAHHIVPRSAQSGPEYGRLFVNVLPIVRSTHSRITNEGLSVVLEEFSLSEFYPVVAALRVTLEYIKSLERERFGKRK